MWRKISICFVILKVEYTFQSLAGTYEENQKLSALERVFMWALQ